MKSKRRIGLKKNVASVEMAGINRRSEYLAARLFVASDKVSGETTEYLIKLDYQKVFLSKCRSRVRLAAAVIYFLPMHFQVLAGARRVCRLLPARGF